MNRMKRTLEGLDERDQDAMEKPCKVLILEDDAFWAEIISRNIEQAAPRATVLWASSALEAAVRLDQDREIRLVVADQCLASLITGLDVWRVLENAGRRIPFILTSGTPASQALDSFGLDSARPCFIAKPFSNSDFQSAVHWMLKTGNQTRVAQGVASGNR